MSAEMIPFPRAVIERAVAALVVESNAQHQWAEDARAYAGAEQAEGHAARGDELWELAEELGGLAGIDPGDVRGAA